MSTKKSAGRKQILIQDLARSRQEILKRQAKLREACDIKARILGSVRRQPAKWALGSTLAGLLGSRLMRRKKSQVIMEKSKRGLFSSILSKLLISIAKPLLTDLLRNYALRRTNQLR